MTKRILFILLSVFMSAAVNANESLCAVVEIEIAQELTIERQGFEAVMKIDNALDDQSLSSVNITVNFADEYDNPVIATSDPNAEDASFFIRVTSMEGVSAIDGTGVIEPKAKAEIRWLIIPAPGAGGERASGTLYFVGADLDYTLGGETETIPVAPDTIYVKPMPLLQLDYFLPKQVLADDPFTTAVEPSIPFSLGVRIQNNGYGKANNIKIDSAQPEIVENDQGLLIGFELLGSAVDDAPVANSLLLEFGDISSSKAKTGRWQMQTSLSGRFTEFTAEFSHADELGGALTSLIDENDIKTHELIRDVRVDVAERDGIRDFLANDVDGIKVYESDAVVNDVVDVSNDSTLVLNQDNGNSKRYTLNVPTEAGFIYTKLIDPFSGSQKITSVLRSDGKVISDDNAWFSAVQIKGTPDWNYHFNLFDSQTTGSYQIDFMAKEVVPQAPVLQFIPQRVIAEQSTLAFIVEASDADGTIPTIIVEQLPDGASFVDNGDGTANLSWTPNVGQAGSYPIRYIASDGVLVTDRIATITVNPANDTDGDGIDDQWELDNFGDLDQNATSDFDGDGISDLEEYQLDKDPTIADGPSVPSLVSPLNRAEVTELQPNIVLGNSQYDGTFAIKYIFEVFSDEAMSDLVTAYYAQPQGDDETTWKVSSVLVENSTYYWRARSSNGFVYSPWVNGQFKVNTENEAPSEFTVTSPQDGVELETTTPLLSSNISADVDGDTLHYVFTVYEDLSLSSIVAQSDAIFLEEGVSSVSWSVTPELNQDAVYYWNVLATDEHQLSTLSNARSFLVKAATNLPPSLPSVTSPINNDELAEGDVTLLAATAVDPESDILTYFFELDIVNSFDSSAYISSGEVTPTSGGSVEWQTSTIADDTTHYWRVKAVDSAGNESGWASAQFFVSETNNAPTVPTINNPGHEAWIDTLEPKLVVNPSTDIDGDFLFYEFELYAGQQTAASLTPEQMLLLQTASEPELLLELSSDSQWYSWRARAKDDGGLVSGWSDVVHFYVDNNVEEAIPTLTWVQPVTSTLVNEDETLTLAWDDEDTDSDATIQLYYVDYNGVRYAINDTPIAENDDGSNDEYVWNVSNDASAGTYTLLAVISDGTQTVEVEGLASFTVAGSSLIAYYDFNSASGSTVFDKSEGTPLNLQMSDLSAATWLEGGGLAMSGGGHLVSVGGTDKITQAVQSTGQLTISTWLDIGPDPFAVETIATIGDYKAIRNMHFGLVNGQVHTRIRTTTTVESSLYPYVQWNGAAPGLTHIVLTWKSGRAILYVNGTTVNHKYIWGNIQNWMTGLPLYVGANADNTGNWNGNIFELSFYNEALQWDEVEALYQQGRPTSGVVSSNNTAPVAPNENVTLRVGETMTWLSGITDAEYDPLSCTIQSAEPWVTVAADCTSVSADTTNVAAGTYNIEFNVSDGTNNTTASWTVTVSDESRVLDSLLSFYDFTTVTSGDSISDEIDSADTARALVVQNTNNVEWVEGEGLHIMQPTMLIAGAGINNSELKNGETITFELWVSPDSVASSSRACIAGLAMDSTARNFTFEQAGVDIQGRLRTTESGTNTFPYVTSYDAFTAGEFVHLVYTYDETHRGKIYVNGEYTGGKFIWGEMTNWDESYTLIVGNENTDDRAWLGTINMLAIYKRALTQEEVTTNFEAGRRQ